MKEKEIREISECYVCDKPFGHRGDVVFYRLKLTQYAINAKAIHRQTGLGMAMGNAKLAQVMGPNEDMAKKMSEHEVTLCGKCVMENLVPLMLLEESTAVDSNT